MRPTLDQEIEKRPSFLTLSMALNGQENKGQPLNYMVYDHPRPISNPWFQSVNLGKSIYHKESI